MSRQDVINNHAAIALDAARVSDWQTAELELGKVAKIYGHESIANVMLRWIDTVANHIMPEYTVGKPIKLSFQSLDTGQIDHDTDNVPHTAVWAGRLMTARMADDLGTFIALLKAVPADEQPEHITALLRACAAAMNHAPEFSRK